MQFNFEKYQLRSVSFFRMLRTEETRFAIANSERREYKKGQMILGEGTHPKGVYIIRKGWVKIHNSNPDGKESILYIYSKGEFFGYRPLVCDEVNPVSATAMEDTAVLFIPKPVFFHLLDHSPAFARALLSSATSEFTVWINKMTLLSQNDVTKRTAFSLLLLSRDVQNKNARECGGSVKISRDDLAAYVGTAKESVVRTLRIFKDAKAITTHGAQISIIAPDLLLGYATSGNLAMTAQ